MSYYKVRIRSYDSHQELWIAVEAAGFHEAMKKAHERCSFTRNIYYPLEQSLLQITEQEYNLFLRFGSKQS